MANIVYEKEIYKIDSKHKIRIFNVKIVKKDNIVLLRKTSGLLDGKKIIVDTVIDSGKNIGKINEKNREEQAISEAESLIQNKLKLEYSNKISEIKPILLPMLATIFEEKVKYPVYLQPKLDGARALFINNKFISRKNTEYLFLDKIKNFNKIKFPSNLIWDGELYEHGKELNEIISVIRQQISAKNIGKLKFIVYDVFDLNNPTATYTERLKLIEKYIKKNNIIENLKVKSSSEIYTLHDKYIKKGYEGVMIKKMEGQYRPNFRSKDVQKYKTFKDSEFKVVDYKEGKGRDAGSIVFILETKNKKETFSCRPKGSLEERIEAFKNGKSYIGKNITVKYQKIQKDTQKPQFPVCDLFIRDIY